ncbi:GNAT family N-acetyltransferase [Azohydromonas sp.]|uniref:GNAT family N-acetyltransferase n=1 Tax=Azohydromonas sp. TaxID=1872666 RepID=UPI002C66C0C3|nr:GNAT family N-acetyltransferase [Azohydromonas sp.]HMM86228.1 GNAT family N-acetyltransferase [Azohydromonas sp.]
MSMQITLRRARPSDAEAFERMMNRPEVHAGLMQLPYTTADFWRARLAEPGGPAVAELHLVAEVGGEMAGSAGEDPVGPAVRRRHAMMLGISVAPEWQRRGVGSALMAALCEYADRWLGVLRLELTVYVDNAPAIALYRKYGFEHEGTHRAYALRDGVYVDAHAMARLHPNPPRPSPG